MDTLRKLTVFVSDHFNESVAAQKATLNALFAISKKTLDLEKKKELVICCLTHVEKIINQVKLKE